MSPFGGPVLNLESAAQVLATFIFLAAVDHEIVGSGLWDYQLWNDVSPVRIQADGSRVPLDVYQRLVHSNFNLNVRRTMLLDDFSGLALDPRGAAAFQRFRRDLTDLQVRHDRLRGDTELSSPVVIYYKGQRMGVARLLDAVANGLARRKENA